MTGQLLTTKLCTPRQRPDLVLRPRLTEQLTQGLRAGHKLTLLSASPGFGKTTLLVNWTLTIENCRVAWLSLDESDNDPACFLTYVVAALQTVQPNLGETALAMLHAPQQLPVKAILTALLNEVAGLTDEVVLVLDDYHVITSPLVHHAVEFLLDHIPQPIHLVIATRSDPPLPLARYRSRNQLLEIRADDLRFTPDEAALFLNQVMGLDLSAQDLATLASRTEGWIAGLQMAALAMQGTLARQSHSDLTQFVQAFSGSHRYILDYLVQEVLDRQAQDVQTFLLETSILDRLTGPLCDAVTGRTDGQAMLEKLERANLFLVSLDDERCWYRYHHLLADLLQARLRHTRPERLPELHRRASAWHAAHGQISQALEHALAGNHFELSAQIVEQAGSSMLATGGWGQLLMWLRALPDELVRVRPTLSLFYAAGLVLTQQLEDVERRLSDVERAMSETRTQKDGLRLNWRGQIAAIRGRAAYLRGDLHRAIEQSREALALVPQDDLTTQGILAITLGSSYILTGDLNAARQVLENARRVNQAAGNRLFAVDAIGSLAQIQEAQGHLRHAAETYREILRMSADRLDPNVVAAHLNLGNILYEWRDLDGAQQHLQTSLSIARQIYMPDGVLVALLWLARAKLAQGDRTGSSDLLQQARREMQTFPPSIINDYAAATLAQVELVQGDIESAIGWASGRPLPAEDTLPTAFFLRKVEYLTQARLLLAQARLAEAEQFLDKLQAVAETTGLTGYEVEISALQALVCQRCGDAARAMTALMQALKRAEPEGYVSTFVDLGAPMRLLIADSKWQMAKQIASEHMGEYVDQVLAAFPHPEIQNQKSAIPNLLEPLSERELQVLRLLAAGKSNRQIAQELVLATGTVKKHLSNIFGKLNAQNRTECVAHARELSLL